MKTPGRLGSLARSEQGPQRRCTGISNRAPSFPTLGEPLGDRVGGFDLGAVALAHEAGALCLLLGLGHREGEGKRWRDDADERLEVRAEDRALGVLAQLLASMRRWSSTRST